MTQPTHSPEPWRTDGEYADHGGYREVLYDANGNECYGEADFARIVACVNFCREFSTEFLEKHQLHYFKRSDEIAIGKPPAEWKNYALCRMLPVKEKT